MNNKETSLLIIGIFIIITLVKILKKTFKISRPIKSNTYGMPSTRSAVLSFISTYLFLKTHNINDKTTILLILIPLLLCYIKYYTKEHNVLQLVVGSIIGIIVAKIIDML